MDIHGETVSAGHGRAFALVGCAVLAMIVYTKPVRDQYIKRPKMDRGRIHEVLDGKH